MSDKMEKITRGQRDKQGLKSTVNSICLVNVYIQFLKETGYFLR